MQQMSSAIDEVAGHADGAASAAQTANQQAAEGSRSVNHVRSEIGKLAAQIDVTEGEVQALANQSENLVLLIEKENFEIREVQSISLEEQNSLIDIYSIKTLHDAA